ncbi:hypothetical protein H632_c995p0 [Helicosporidium sp. ATCC 50920]|nr:hypothetical protein H632_c995p0 [Helicosporidium sp. ATCC 50920]|eukprot:KDD74908.1 hypothetical protein H632_c995p0 [Helicosporidium sp. ATCC 50920]
MVVAAEIVRGRKRPYLAGVSVVEPRWLPELCPALTRVEESPMQVPEPAYDARADAVLAHFAASFGPHAWPLPPVQKPLLRGSDAPRRRAEAFALALLAGEVFSDFGRLANALRVGLADLRGAGVRARVQLNELVHALEAEKVDSRAALLARLRLKPHLLARELAAMYRPGVDLQPALRSMRKAAQGI